MGLRRALESSVQATRVSGALLSVVMGFAQGGCLKINPDHDVYQRSEAPNNAENPADSASAPIEQPSDSETSDQVPPPDSTSTSTSTSTNLSDESSSESTSTSSLDSSSTISSTSSDTTSSSAAPTPIDIDTSDGTWRELELSLDGLATKPAAAGYSMQLYFDHSVFVSAGADANGDDLSVVFVENDKGYAVDRMLDPGYRWNHTATRIWFPLQQPMAPGETVSGKYYLVTGSSQFPAKGSPDGVFLQHDHFQGPSLDLSKWSLEQQGIGASSHQFETDGLRLSAPSTTANLEAISIKSRWHGRLNGVLAEMRMRFPNPVNASCNQLMPLAFETETNDQVQHSLILRAGDWLHGYPVEGMSNLQYILLSGISVNGDWGRYSIAWSDTQQRAWQDTVEHVNRSTQTLSSPTPDDYDLHLRIQSGSGIGSCTGSSASDIDIDWVWIRHYQLPEPQTVLK